MTRTNREVVLICLEGEVLSVFRFLFLGVFFPVFCRFWLSSLLVGALSGKFSGANFWFRWLTVG